MKYLLGAILLLLIAKHAESQDMTMLQSQKQPLVLQSIGSFFVGGQSTLEDRNAVGDFTPGGHITIGQMYVQYMKPFKRVDNTNWVLIHGMTLTGKCWETTPDGRMGWYEYLVRKGYSTYVVDQANSGRSGFNTQIFNEIKSGQKPVTELPRFVRLPDENVWFNFRIGPAKDSRYPDAKLSDIGFKELSRQAIPFKFLSHEDLVTNYQNFSSLAASIKNTIFISHSQSGDFPLRTYLISPAGIKAAVIVEPGDIAADYSEEDIQKLAKLPMLVIFGDHLDNYTQVEGHTWERFYIGWKIFADKINKEGGKLTMLYLPEQGIKGNGHMIMQEDNNIEVADLILKWKKSI